MLDEDLIDILINDKLILNRDQMENTNKRNYKTNYRILISPVFLLK